MILAGDLVTLIQYYFYDTRSSVWVDSMRPSLLQSRVGSIAERIRTSFLCALCCAHIALRIGAVGCVRSCR